MRHREFAKGLHDIGDGHYAYLLPPGTWGYSNAGLICDADEALLVDTLFDLRLTREMLDEIRNATGFSADDIGTVINTHANGDHTHGNILLPMATTIASEASARGWREFPPQQFAELIQAAPAMGDLGDYILERFGAFDFSSIMLRDPDRVFSGILSLSVGDKRVDLIEVGPAHTDGDTLIYVPEDKVLYTGDILFVDGTPIAWSGPVSNWLRACEMILGLDVETIVPGHGPVTNKRGVKRVADYLSAVQIAARQRFDAGMDAWSAAQDISFDEFGAWEDPERIAVTVDTLYREFASETGPRDPIELFTRMAKLAKVRGKPRAAAE